MRTLYSAVAVSAILLTGCDAGPLTGPDNLAPDDAAFARGAPVHSVTGGGTVAYDLPGYQGNEIYGISARSRSDGSVDGMIEMHWPAPYDMKAHGTVTCLNNLGNGAWLGFEITRTNQPDGFFAEGSQWVFYVVDNGSGAGTPADQVSYFFPTANAQICSALAGPPAVLFDWTNGNLTVR